MCVVAYVSGHGFGHSAREIEILRHLPADIPLIVKTSAAAWFWRDELARPFELIADSFDIGCVQHDSIRIDVPATLTAYQQIAARNATRRTAEADYLRRVGARLVLSDVPPFPLAVAADAGIPSVCVCNFTWADIYEGFVSAEPDFAPIVDTMRAQYQTATLCLDTDLSIPMPYWPRREFVGLVARPGVARPDAFRDLLPPDVRHRRVALIYLGNWGYTIDYARLEAFADWQFVSYEKPPQPVANWTVIEREREWPHPDLVASVDLVISKPGYGIVAECLSTGTPLLYPPRPEFVEYDALHAALAAWPGGLWIDRESFLALNWESALAAVPDRASVPALPAQGGPHAAQRIGEIYYAKKNS